MPERPYKVWKVAVAVNCTLSHNSSYLSDHFSRDGGLTDSRLAPAFNPVDGSWFLVSAVVPTDSHHLQLWEVLLQSAQSLLCTLQADIVIREFHWDYMSYTFLQFHNLKMCIVLSNNWQKCILSCFPMYVLLFNCLMINLRYESSCTPMSDFHNIITTVTEIFYLLLRPYRGGHFG